MASGHRDETPEEAAAAATVASLGAGPSRAGSLAPRAVLQVLAARPSGNYRAAVTYPGRARPLSSAGSPANATSPRAST